MDAEPVRELRWVVRPPRSIELPLGDRDVTPVDGIPDDAEADPETLTQRLMLRQDVQDARALARTNRQLLVLQMRLGLGNNDRSSLEMLASTRTSPRSACVRSKSDPWHGCGTPRPRSRCAVRTDRRWQAPRCAWMTDRRSCGCNWHHGAPRLAQLHNLDDLVRLLQSNPVP